MSKHHMLADVVIIFGIQDIVFGKVDKYRSQSLSSQKNSLRMDLGEIIYIKIDLLF